MEKRSFAWIRPKLSVFSHEYSWLTPAIYMPCGISCSLSRRCPQRLMAGVPELTGVLPSFTGAGGGGRGGRRLDFYCDGKVYTALQRQFHFYIPFLGIVRPHPQFPHSCVCERFIYSQDRSTYFLLQKRQTHRGNI